MRTSFNILAMAALLTACANGHVHDGEEHEEAAHDHGDEIELSAKQQRDGGVETDTVHATTFHEVLHTSGRISGTAGSMMQVCAPASGVVTGLKHAVGNNVAAGQTLLTIVAVPTQSSAAAIELEAASKALKRLERLAPDHIVSAEEVETARQRVQQAEVAAGATRCTVTVPASGTLQQVGAAVGQYVEEGQQLAVVNTNRDLRLEVDVPGHYAGHSYTSAHFATASAEDICTATRLEGGSNAVDGNGCTQLYFGSLSATPTIGTYCEVWLMGTERQDVVTVPCTALSEDQGTYYVFVRQHGNHFARRIVTLGDSDGKRVEIKSGLKDGECVVTQGIYTVRAAGMKAAIPGHTHNH